MWHADMLLVLVAAIIYGLAFVFRSIRWKQLLKPMGVLSLIRTFWALMFGFFLNEVLPFRAGEFARAFLVARWLDIPTATTFGTIVSERMGDIFSLFLLCILVSLKLPGAKFPIKSLALALLIGACVMGALIRWKDVLRSKQTNSIWLKKTLGTMDRLIQGFQFIGSARQTIQLILSSIAVWCFDGLAVHVLAKSYGIGLSTVGTGALMVGIALGVMVPAAPGYIGTYEYFGEKTLKLIGIPPQTALTFVISLHLFQMIMIAAFGVPTLARYGIPKKSDPKASFDTSINH